MVVRCQVSAPEDSSAAEFCMVCNMGNQDRDQPKLSFEKKWFAKSTGMMASKKPSLLNRNHDPVTDSDIKNLLLEMKHSLHGIHSKIDTLSNRLDHMKDRLNKHEI
ncbi:hypothetical protein NDU88_001784 [Pleurodeles waltl]|uniref:Uncharacterized protein n=1 Tax=Pleurodeles waltl TaxID=8319 RepID=A0AAV7VCG9_PLEWA|nr:hypothetical protein NDU88_001784 [Pleurodeles waltl]